MKINTTLHEPSAVVLWDESFLWGLIALRTLRQKGLAFRLIRAGDIRAGALDGHKLLFVPGGWASNKLKALGDGGVEAIRQFVRDGGNYLGFCGGAGLATQDGLGLLDIQRVPSEYRVPSFSGQVLCSVDDHLLWSGIYKPVFWAWWPSQFRVKGNEVRICAQYDKALPDAYSSDIRVGSVRTEAEWSEREAKYGIHLNPARLAGEPAVVEGFFGKGRVLLSLLHFDTPDDARGNRVLRQAWSNLGGTLLAEPPAEDSCRLLSGAVKTLLHEARALIAVGESLRLWRWRTHWVLQWKRGVRGLEYCTLANMAAALAENLSFRFGDDIPEQTTEKLLAVAHLFASFRTRAELLLHQEYEAMMQEPLAYDRCSHPAMQELRISLFGSAKSYGGEFKTLLDEIDSLLFQLISPAAA